MSWVIHLPPVPYGASLSKWLSPLPPLSEAWSEYKVVCSSCAPSRWLSFIAVPRRKENSFQRRLADKIISCTVVSVILAIISISHGTEKSTGDDRLKRSEHIAGITMPIRLVFVMREDWMRTGNRKIRAHWSNGERCSLYWESWKDSFRKHWLWDTGTWIR